MIVRLARLPIAAGEAAELALLSVERRLTRAVRPRALCPRDRDALHRGRALGRRRCRSGLPRRLGHEAHRAIPLRKRSPVHLLV
eukprot:3619177-Prymnesium_polylepis.1